MVSVSLKRCFPGGYILRPTDWDYIQTVLKNRKYDQQLSDMGIDAHNSANYEEEAGKALEKLESELSGKSSPSHPSLEKKETSGDLGFSNPHGATNKVHPTNGEGDDAIV